MSDWDACPQIPCITKTPIGNNFLWTSIPILCLLIMLIHLFSIVLSYHCETSRSSNGHSTAIITFLSLYLLSIWYRHDLLQTSWSEIDCRRAEAEERRGSVFVGGSRSLAGGVRREETSPYLGLYQEVHMMNTCRKYLALHQLELCSQENVKSWKIFRQNLWKRVLLGHEHINFKSIWAQCTSVSAI